jgi:cytochrome c-type biogenesis protein CcmE
MKAKHQRLTLAVVAVVAVMGSAVLAMSAAKDKAAYFRSPADLAKAKPPAGEDFRLGGMVADKSITRSADGVSIKFIVEDGGHVTPVTFRGITPDLFKENSGVVAEGSLDGSGTFVATNILAKHDENYKPPEMAGVQHKTDSLRP